MKTKVLLITLTCKVAFNVDGLTIHSMLNILFQQSLFNLPKLSLYSLNGLTC
jgi:hypothetical protein